MYPTANAPQSIPIDVKRHPEWPKFRDSLSLYSMLNRPLSEDEILFIWTKTLMGIKLQKEMNRTGRRYEVNSHFADLAEAMKAELRILPSKPLALWSGGYDVSLYARQKKGCTTLESTILGGVFDELELYSDWKCIGPLWNAISRKFVEQGYGFVHVFMRVHAPDSVLYREEVPALQAKTGDGLPPALKVKGINWHALFGDGSWQQLKEINAQGDLVSHYAFLSEPQARMAMKNFLVRRSQAKQPATYAGKEMKID